MTTMTFGESDFLRASRPWWCPNSLSNDTPAVAEEETMTMNLFPKMDTLILATTSLWNARAAIAHLRLLPKRFHYLQQQQQQQPSQSSSLLHQEIYQHFQICLAHVCGKVDNTALLDDDDDNNQQHHCDSAAAAQVLVEWGLAQHYMDCPSRGKVSFWMARQYSGLQVSLTGAMGKRTKFQIEAKAQLFVQAKSRKENTTTTTSTTKTLTASTSTTTAVEAVRHDEDEILLEQIAFEEDVEKTPLSLLDQTIILALCLNVKNNNPSIEDDLTAEEMGAYLARVLDHASSDKTNESKASSFHSNWMIYSTALLERAWLEFDASGHGRERALLQLQALADQHLNRLTLTQSTFDAVETDSAPVQDRLLFLHQIVYPPRWTMISDLAERYAKLGIVTSAAQLFEEIELWDQVVECLRLAGRQSRAIEIVQQRLKQDDAANSSPRMWAALGDLTGNAEHYHTALKVSHGRYSDAHVALGKIAFDAGRLLEAADYYKKALAMRPLLTHVWFRLGTIGMQIKDWTMALQALSKVVQQEPTESDAWANVAAIHMHNKHPEQAYPALVESLRYRRNNWRVWVNKLYICIDLKKYDEAVQACHVLMDLHQKSASNNDSSKQAPLLEEKCVRGIVGGVLKDYSNSFANDHALESARRTLTRLQTLLDRLASSSQTRPWVYETLAYFYDYIGSHDGNTSDEKSKKTRQVILDYLKKEYRALQEYPDWEKDVEQMKKIVQVACQMVALYKQEETKDALIKCRFLLRGVTQKIKSAYSMDESKIPNHEMSRLTSLMDEINTRIKEL